MIDLKSNLNRLLIAMAALAIIFIVVFWFWWGTNEIIVSKAGDKKEEPAEEDVSPISGVKCKNAGIRPIAVMMPSDPVTRPLSGLADADMVFEMPVTPGGVTRIMAVFQCSEPEEIGSIRSAREDFIPLAGGLDAVYIHWGGEKEALAKLNRHIIDNIDAMIYENKYFYRKSGLRAPHNGFTDWNMAANGIEDLGYRKENNFSGYPHLGDEDRANAVTEESIIVNYPPPFDIKWMYDGTAGAYSRLRGGKLETDKNTGAAVKASVIIIMRTTSEYSNKDYLTVKTVGGGDAVIYQKGMKITGRWEKGSDINSKLNFYDNNGKEIKFAAGTIWAEFITN